MSEHRIVDPDLLRAMREADLDARKGIGSRWDEHLQAMSDMLERALAHRTLLLQYVERLEKEVKALEGGLAGRQPQAEWKDRPDEPGWWVWCDPEDFDDVDDLSQPAGLVLVTELLLKLDYKLGLRWLRIPDPPIPT